MVCVSESEQRSHPAESPVGAPEMTLWSAYPHDYSGQARSSAHGSQTHRGPHKGRMIFHKKTRDELARQRFMLHIELCKNN
jgi:hypothetical protein